jgi:hypothetical protein
MAPGLAVSVRNTFVHVVGVENDSDQEDESLPVVLRTRCRSKTAPNVSFDLREKLNDDLESDDGVDTADVTESSAVSSDIEWQPCSDCNASEQGDGAHGADVACSKNVETQVKARRTVRFAAPPSESGEEEPTFADRDTVRERQRRRAVTLHAYRDVAPKDEPMFVSPFPRGEDGEGRRRRRVATWHGASAESVDDMLEAPTFERVATRDPFESPTAFPARPVCFADLEEFDDSPQPGLSHAITRDFFDSQDMPSPRERSWSGQQGQVSDISAPSTHLPAYNGMAQAPCFAYPWMLDVNTFAQWSMMMAAHHHAAQASADCGSGAPAPQHNVKRQLDRRPVAASGGDAAQRTTVMLRNLPNNYKRDEVLKLLDKEGFSGKYDFVYFPIDFDTGAALGYAFVNFVSTADAEAGMQSLEGFSQWHVTSDKVCTVAWSQHSQVLATHVQRYRNSPLMHELVPDGYRPVLFEGGQRVAFPSPTKKIKAPRKGTRLMLV